MITGLKINAAARLLLAQVSFIRNADGTVNKKIIKLTVDIHDVVSMIRDALGKRNAFKMTADEI